MCSLFPLGLCTPGTDIHLTESELKGGAVKEAWRGKLRPASSGNIGEQWGSLLGILYPSLFFPFPCMACVLSASLWASALFSSLQTGLLVFIYSSCTCKISARISFCLILATLQNCQLLTMLGSLFVSFTWDFWDVQCWTSVMIEKEVTYLAN